jgi:hypothetical protein
MIDFLCIGAQKAGTTWLIENLKMHPNVWTPPFMKELHYFDIVHVEKYLIKSYLKKIQRQLKNHPDLDAYSDKLVDPKFAYTDAWYQYIFSLAPIDKIKGECTPIYSALDHKGIEHVHRLMPNARLIYMIRDPYERAMSSLRMIMERRKISDRGVIAEILGQKKFKSRGDYASNIPRWESMFDPGKILYIPFGLIKSQPDRVMVDVERHLNLKPFSEYPMLNDAVHTTKKANKTISTEITGMVRNMVDPQYAYLSERFGDEFLAATK